MILHRRSFLVGLGASLFAAPAIVRAASLMPVKAVDVEAVWRQIHDFRVDFEALRSWRVEWLQEWEKCANAFLPPGQLNA